MKIMEESDERRDGRKSFQQTTKKGERRERETTMKEEGRERTKEELEGKYVGGMGGEGHH